MLVSTYTVSVISASVSKIWVTRRQPAYPPNIEDIGMVALPPPRPRGVRENVREPLRQPRTTTVLSIFMPAPGCEPGDVEVQGVDQACSDFQGVRGFRAHAVASRASRSGLQTCSANWLVELLPPVEVLWSAKTS